MTIDREHLYQLDTNIDTLTRFEHYLRCSNEKMVESAHLTRIVAAYHETHGQTRSSLKILDIGGGDGSLLLTVVHQILVDCQITVVEPSPDLLVRYRARAAQSEATQIQLSEIGKTWEEAPLGENFDIIIMSHVYLSRDIIVVALQKMLQHAESGGQIIVIEKAKDDVYYFKAHFKSIIRSINFVPKTIDEVGEQISNLEYAGITQIVYDEVVSELRWPNELDQRVPIIEFFLNCVWAELSREIQDEIINWIDSKPVFNQITGFLKILL